MLTFWKKSVPKNVSPVLVSCHIKGNIKLNHKIKNHKIKTLIKNEVLDFSY